MKKIVASLIFTAMLVSLAACGSTNTEAEENTTENAVTDPANKESAAADNKSAPEETDRSTDHMEDCNGNPAEPDIIESRNGLLTLEHAEELA